MEYADFQRDVLNYLKLAKVTYHPRMWGEKHELGYAIKGTPYDGIHLAKDFPDEDVIKVALLHECGHVYFGHIYEDVKGEFKKIRDIFDELNIPFAEISALGGLKTFLNIAMDLEINTKLLTIANLKATDKYFKLCTTDFYGIDVADGFRDYYKPLAEYAHKKFNDNEDSDDGEGNSSKENGNESNGDDNGGNGKSPDIFNDISSLDDTNIFDLPKEIRDVLMNENYSVPTNAEESSDTKTVEEVMESLNEGCKGYGEGSSIGVKNLGDYDVVENTDKNISNFIRSITKISTSNKIDSMRHYNRGTRDNKDGILYSTVKQSIGINKPTIGVLVDVSNSMYTESIIKAMSSLYSIRKDISSKSVICFWDEALVDEYNILKFKGNVNQIGTGGTNIASGVKYLKEQKKCDTIIIYSDMETDFDLLLKEMNGVKVYTIFVSSDEDIRRPSDYSCNDLRWKTFVKKNKKMIMVK